MGQAKNKKLDEGLKYVLELGLTPARTNDEVKKVLQQKLGREKCDEIIEYIIARGEDQDKSMHERDKTLDLFYDLKNSSLEASLTITGLFEGDYIRRCCNYMYENRAFFGKTILEVGCDCGILSCFIARMCPEAQILSIDRNESSLRNAKLLADRLGVDNIEFKQMDLQEMNLDDKFETIVSSKVMHENIEDVVEDLSLLFKSQGNNYCKATEKYAEILTGHLTDNGILFSIERCGKNPLLYGWLLALSKFGWILDSDRYKEIESREVNDLSYFQALVCRKGAASDEDVFKSFYGQFMKDKREDLDEYGGWESKVILAERAKDLIDGYYLFEPNGDKYGKTAIWNDKNNPDLILREMCVLEENWHIVTIHDSFELDEAIEVMNNDLENLLQQNITAKKIIFENGNEIIV